jgi:hypothetical protein
MGFWICGEVPHTLEIVMKIDLNESVVALVAVLGAKAHDGAAAEESRDLWRKWHDDNQRALNDANDYIDHLIRLMNDANLSIPRRNDR